jgi:dTDP-4-amino-4,6-dideoxygalactose transaminase/predicted dehydrogenase
MYYARKIADRMMRLAKKAAKYGIRRVKALVPPSPERLTGKLAKDGGIPVRKERIHPWPCYPSGGFLAWPLDVGPRMKELFQHGAEGLPQEIGNRFAKQWAEYCGAAYALLLPHGTDALRIALAAALDHDGLDYGGEIIVPNLTFIASANAALDRRFGVALVDVDPNTLLLDPKRVEEAIIPGKTRAIMAVHLFGHPCDMGALREIATRHSLVLVEDAAQAHGAIHDLGRVGALGDVAGFSFQSSKNLSAGEGGALTTNSEAIYNRAYSLHDVGRSKKGRQRWEHLSLGWNCRTNEYTATVLLHRLRALEEQQQTRYKRFLQLREMLGTVSCVAPLAVGPGLQRHGVHMFSMRYHAEVCGGLHINDFIKAVNAEGIPLFRGYDRTLAQQPALQAVREKHPEFLRLLPTPIADSVTQELIGLDHPVFLGGEKDLLDIVSAFRKVQRHYGGSGSLSSAGPLAHAVATSTVTAAVTTPQEAPRKSIRFGIIGVGIMGQNHASAIARHNQATLVGVTDTDVAKGQQIAAKFKCKVFASAADLIKSGEVDAVVIATPHWQHGTLAIQAAGAGLHIVCEKPLTVTVAEADKVLEAVAEHDIQFAVVYQTRLAPAYRRAKQLIASGELGEIYRCSMVESAWRTDAYYRSSSWRGSWKGEGGGVLLNQAPHMLDRYAWLCGMPESLFAHCDTHLHKIEVEDTVSAVLRHRNGLHGHIHISTIECPFLARTEICCDRGRITIDNDRLFVVRLHDSIRTRTSLDSRFSGDIDSELLEIPTHQLEDDELLNVFYDNLVAAINGDATLASPGNEARNSVELANAMILSSACRREIALPIDRQEYTDFIANKIGA